MAKWKTTRCLRNTVLFGTTALLILTANLLTVFGGFFYEPAVYVLFAANLLLNVSVFWDLGQHVRRDFPMMVFAGTFDILLLGRVYIAFFSDPGLLLYNLEATNYENLFVALQVVNLSFLFVYAAYRLSGLLFARREKAIRENGAAAYPQSPLLPVIRQISVVVLLASSIAFFYVLLLSILNVFRTGSYLKSFTLVSETSVPTVISRMSLFFVPSFAVFLATLPDKKQLKWPMVVYTVYMLASLFTGRRNTFVTEALMIMIYFVMRDTLLKKDRRILKKRTVAIGAVVAVAGMYLLQVFAEVRSGGFKFDKNFLTLFSNFFYSQGASFRVVVQTVNKWDYIDHTISWQYLFYPFEMFIHNNQITRALFGFTPIVEVQNLAFVQYTHNYAHVLTYMVDPGRYL
jgi:oligosaccharide repeat unit polymerase